MNKLLFCMTTAVLGTSAQAAAGEISSALQAVVSANPGSANVPIIVTFTDQLDVEALRTDHERELQLRYADPQQRKANRRRVKRAMIIEEMKQKSQRAMQQMESFLKSHQQKRRLKALWAINSVAAEVPANLIDKLATLNSIKQITLDAKIQGPVTGYASTAPHFWNLDATHAPLLWEMGFAGQGSVVASLDTGVDKSHPDLAPKWRGRPGDWFDPYQQEAAPVDWNGHGTQVMGLIVGGDTGGYQIGMAPAAQWIAAKIFDNSNQGTLSGIHQAFQWVLDPDGEVNTDDAPDIVNNSWNLEGTVNQCNQEFYQDTAVLKEAEIAVLFAGGNYGPGVATSVSPANSPAVLSVGSINSQFTANGSNSSQGPGACNGGIFPNMVAPGVDILTDDRMPLFYNYVSGTSFAVAHVSGGMALLKGVFQNATVTQLETAVIERAVDLGAPGPDNIYGNGMLDVGAAYAWLEANIDGGTNSGSFSFSNAAYSIDENVAVLTVTVSRSSASGEASVNYASADQTATAGQDYVSAEGTLHFAAGETSRTFNITLLDDGLYEGDENFTLILSDPQGGATLGDTSAAAVTILENDTQAAGDMQFSSAAYSVSEDGNQIIIDVIRSNGSAGTATVAYATANGTATAGSDYQPVSGELSFADGQTRASFAVALLDDTAFEGDETVTLLLSNPSSGASLGTPVAATLTLIENDPPGPMDADNDGFNSDAECDDHNAAVYPGAPEIKQDGIDQDCNGFDLTIELTRIWYTQSKDQFMVWASSDLGSQANFTIRIQLANGQAVNRQMTWSAAQNRWQLTINGFAAKYSSKPTAVIVSGIEGSESGPVVRR
jgi:subtilisin family serine protease